MVQWWRIFQQLLYIWHNTFHIYHIYPLRSMGSDHTFLTFTSSTITSVDPQIWGQNIPLKMERYLKTQSCMVKTNKYALIISFICIFQNQSVGIYVHQISIEMLSLSCVHSVFVCVYPDDGYINKPLILLGSSQESLKIDHWNFDPLKPGHFPPATWENVNRVSTGLPSHGPQFLS